MFKPVDANPDFSKLERETLERWKKDGIIEKYLHKNDESKKSFRFLDGPITANNSMGVHHAHGRALKDFFQRYYNLKGYKQRFQNGFDCQGLWVEVEVEKEMGFNSKREIENYGLANFSKACRRRVDKFSQVQAEQSQRLGMFMDWENSYYTMSETNNLYIWHFLKECQKRGWLYKGTDSMPWCSRCGTAISNHELSDGGYQIVKHESVYVKFPIKGKKGESLLIWTTTPWTLLANVAVAVNPKFDYVKVEVEGEKDTLIVGRSRLQILGKKYTVLAEFKGGKLIDLEYDGPFDKLPANRKVEHRVISWDEVGEEEGTGLVHIAPGAGHEDFELHLKYKLDLIAPLDENGIYQEGFGDFTGKSAHKVKNEVFTSLKKKGLFYKTEWIEHSYPCCWRCKEELVFRTTSEWFIKVTPEFRRKIRQVNRAVNWIPVHAGKRMDDWLKNMGDWPISRQRYWGLALPFFECECGELTVVDSKKELKKLALEPRKVDTLPELHRPWIDGIKIKCPQCGEVVERITDVGDCWLDAGIVPFSTVKYLEDKKYWREWYPFDFITEYFSQIKLWFYTTLFMSTALEGKAPWKTVLATGFIVDEKGEAMHKSKGNAIWFDEAVEKMGADVMRWIYFLSPASHSDAKLPFGFHLADEARRRFHLILWNVYKFFVTYANLDDWKPAKKNPSELKLRLLDKWLLERLDQVVWEVTQNLDKYDAAAAGNLLEGFVINDLSTWYVRLVRDRVSPSSQDKKDKEVAYHVLHQTLLILCRLLAPFIPFMSDKMYKNLTGEPSVHFSSWPKLKVKPKASILIEKMNRARQIVELGHSGRKEKGVKVRQPLAGLTYFSNHPRLESELEALIQKELNVKAIKYEREEGELRVDLDFNLTPDLIEEGKVREITRQIQVLRKSLGCKFNDLVRIYFHGDPDLVALIEKNQNDIQKEVLIADSIQSFKPNILGKEVTINQAKIWLGIEKR